MLSPSRTVSANALAASDSARTRRGWMIEFVLLGALWGASFLFMRLGAAEFGPLPTAGMRVLVATLFLMPIVALRGKLPDLKRHWKPMCLAGILNSALPFALFSYAVLHIPTGLTSILNATVPMFGALAAWAWLGDRLNASRIFGLLLGFVGVAALALERTQQPASGGGAGWAVLACLAATLCYGIAASYAKRFLTGVHPLATAGGSQLGATLGLALPTVALWPERMPSVHAWLAVVALGVLCTGIAYVLYFRLIERAGPSRALTVTFLIPVFAVGYGAVVLGERVSMWMVGCGAVVVCGTMLATGLLSLPRRLHS